jgi:hypothetical protein
MFLSYVYHFNYVVHLCLSDINFHHAGGDV